MHIGSMNRGVTAGTPTGALPQKGRMQRRPNVNVPRTSVLHLSMAAQAEVGIAGDE